jgi:uncharacterized protein (TIGR01777 family)
VINLAGRSVNCRYGAANRREIVDSRVHSTNAVGEAIARAKNPPRVWLQMSTATIYAHRYQRDNDEVSGILGGEEAAAPKSWRFSIDVAKKWEETLDAAETPSTRKVKMRTAMVMSTAPGGAFHALLRHVRLGFGHFGNGQQFVSWIHERDFVRAVEWLITQERLEGVVNLAAPHPLPMSEFIGAIRDAWGTPFAIPTPEWMVHIGAWLMRTEPELVLKSRRVAPRLLRQYGFPFEFPRWPAAAKDLCARMKSATPAFGAEPLSQW